MPLNYILTITSAVAALLLAAPASAQLLNNYPVDPKLKPVLVLLANKDCRGATRSLDAEDSAGTDPLGVLLARLKIASMCEPKDKVSALLVPALERAAARAPEDYRVALTGLQVGYDFDNAGQIETWLVRLAIGFPNILDQIGAERMGSLLYVVEEEKGKAASDRLTLLVGEAGFGTNPLDDHAKRDGLLRDTALLAEAAGKPDHARRMLLLMLDATEIGFALTDGRLRTHWGALEQSAGPQMRFATARAVEVSKDMFSKQPDAFVAYQNLMRALWADGKRDEALALGQAIAGLPEQAAIADQAERTLIDLHARMLVTMGRIDEADARYAAATRAAGTRPRDTVYLGYHRAQMLARAGRHEAALALIPALRKTAAEVEEGLWQRGLLRAEICARAGLGQVAALPGLKAELLTFGAKEGAGHTAEALLCLGDKDEAARAIIRQLESDDGRIWALETLHAGEVLAYDDPCVWSLVSLRDRPDVAAAIDKAGRILPATLLPAGRAKVFS